MSDNHEETQRQPTLRRVFELALVFVCGGVVLLAFARRGLLVAAPSTAASASVSAPATMSAAPAVAASGDAWPDAGAESEASCAIPDRGVGAYGEQQGLPMGSTMIVPPLGDRYDLLLHLHGGQAARRVVAPANLGVVVAAVDAGVGSQAYAEKFYGPEPLEELLEVVGNKLKPAVLRHLIISSWSAGYGGVREILRQHPTAASAIVFLDSIHAGYEPDGETLRARGLEPFVSLAHRAIAGEAVMVMTHSEIRPPTFASTSEVADYLLGKIGGRREYAGLIESFGVEHKTRYRDGAFIVRGYTGNGKGAHCAHLRLLSGILKEDVLPRLSKMDR